MAYSLTLPNGAVINNIPDNISRNQALDMIKGKMPDAFPEPPGVLSQLVRAPLEIGKGFVRGLTTDPLSGISSLAYTGARAAGAELTPFEQTAFGRGLGEAQTALAPSDTGLITQFAGGLGSLASFIPGGLLKGGIRLATLGTQAAGLGSEEARARAEQARLEGKEVTPEQQFQAQAMGTGIGLTELAPVGRLVQPIEAILRGVKRSDADAIAPGLFNSARRILETGGIEAFQEGMANVLQDLVQKGVYDPNLEVGESALGDAAMGGAVGSFAQGAIELVTRGKRRDIYERLKAQEREQELQDRLAKLQSEEQEQIARTKTNLGIPEETLLALPAPAAPVIDTPTQDPLANPLGNFTVGELTTGISDFINNKRKKDGQSTLETFSIEDIADAGAPQAEIDRIIAGKLSQQGVNVEEGLAQNPSEQDVRNLAQSKGISTDTPGYRHFLSRTTGVEDYGSMSPVQRLAAFNALQNVEEGGILPLGTNAKRFTNQQYDKVKSSIPTLFKDSDTLSPTSVVEQVKKMTGLKSDRDARSLLDTAIRNGELSTAATPVFEVVKDGVILRKYNTRKAAAESADRLNATVRNSTVTDFALPGTLKELPGGPDIRAGRFEAGVEPAGFDIKDASGKTLGGAATQAEAEAKATRFAATRQGEANRLQEEIQKVKEQIGKTQQRLEAMEATGQGGTVGFAKLQADAFAQAKEAQRKIEELSAQQAALAEPLSINSKGTRPVSREGYTFFQDGQPRGTFPTKEAAEEAAIQSYDDAFLERIANTGDQQRGLMPKRLASMARNELARRRGELPQGFGIQYTGTPEQAEAKLAQAGVFTAKTQEQIRELEKKLLPAMKRLGLENVGLRIIKAIESGQGSADGFYASRLITIALDAVDPMGTLRHESIHALKQLGAFKPNEWKLLEKKAKEEWIDKFLKDRFTAQGVSLFDAYKAIYEQDNGSLSGFDAYITEEAIADAFKYFNQTKPPAGLIANLMYRLKQFFSAIENAFKGLGFQTAEDVFTRTEEGRVQAISPATQSGAGKFGLRADQSATMEATGDKTPLSMDGIRIYERELQGLVKKVGDRIAGMDSTKTLEDVRKAVKKLQSYTKQGLEGKEWYERSAQAVLEAFNGDPVLAEKFFQVIAITSANTEVAANFTKASNAWEQFATGRPIKAGTKRENDAIDDLLNFGLDWDGRKTNTFYINLMEAMEGTDTGRSTIDLHMSRMLFDRDSPTDAQYQLGENMVRLLASKVGIPARQVQAASWVTQKAKKMFDDYRERGLKRNMSDEELRNHAFQRALMDYAHLSKSKGFNPTVTPELLEPSASKRARTQVVTGEVIPTTKGFMSQVAELPMNIKEKLTKNIMSESFIQDIGKALGLTSKIRVAQGTGGYDGGISPNLIVRLINPDPAVAVQEARDLSDAMSYVFQQDATPFFRADPALLGQGQLGYRFRFGRAELTPTQERKIFAAMREEVGNDVGYSKTKDNDIVVINYRGEDGNPFLMDDNSFADAMNRFREKADQIVPIEDASVFGAESEYRYNEWNEPTTGQSIIDGLQGRRPERPNLSGQLTGLRDAFVKQARSAVRESGGTPRFQLRSSEFVSGPGPDGGLVLGTKQPGAKSFTGIHYGKQQVNTLAGSRYGTGIKGQEAARLAESKDPRIKKRVYFYIPFPQGMMPPVEAGLGQYVYRQRFGNILPPGDEMTSLYNASEGDYNRFESSVIDAGYDGYAVPNMGMMVIMNHDVPVDYLGTRQELKGTVNLLGNQYSLRAVNTPEFKQWFGSSTITNPDGSPKVMYHGTARDIETFKPKQANAIFVTENPNFAEGFTDMSEEYMVNEMFNQILSPEQRADLVKKVAKKLYKEKEISKSDLDFSIAQQELGVELGFLPSVVQDSVRAEILDMLPSRANIMPLYVRAENPFDYENPNHIDAIQALYPYSLPRDLRSGSWRDIESDRIQNLIKEAGFDSFYVREFGTKNLAVYDPNQVKSAVGNFGAFSRTNNDIRYSLALAGINPQSSLVPDEGGDYLGRLGMQPQKLGGRPINLLIGTHNDLIDELKNEKMYRPVSYGANHILNRVLNNPRRDPGGAQELLERIVRKAQQIARNYSRVYKEGNKLIFFAGNDSLITMEDGSIVTMYRQFDPERKYGNPIWFGRAPAVTDSKPPKGLPVRERDGLVSPKNVETAEKVKRVYTPMDIEELSAAYVEPKKGTLGLKKTAYSLSENKDPAYHSGDLRYGRDTALGRMTGGRSTGHFGTGVYFLSKPPKAPTSERAKLLDIRADRPVQAVDFSQFNLLTPLAEFEAENLHKALRFANDLVDAKFDFEDLEAPSPTRDTKGVSLGRAINRAVDDIQLAANSTRNLKKLGRDEFSKQEIRQAFIDGVKEAQSLIDQYRYGSDYVDSASTRVIKKLGFDGIDVRGLDKFDNNKYGSVIYAEEVAPAPKPRYSLRESIDPTVVDAIDRTTTTRQNQGFGDRMAEAISPTGFTKFRQGFINKYERIAQISRTVAKKFGDQELLADQSAIAAALMSDRASGVAAEAFKRGIPVYDKGYTYVTDMEGQQKGLMQILMPLAERGDPFVYQAFQFYAASKRGKRLDAEGRERLFTPEDMKKAALLEREFPEFKQVFDEYQKFNKGLVDYMKDTGVIDAEMARKWTENWDYIPFYRQLDGERTAGPNIFQSIAGVALPKKLKGGEAPLADFLETITRNTRAAIEAGMKNVAANRVVRDMKRLNDPGGTAPMIEEIKPGERLGPDSITVRENGKTKNYRVADPLLIESLKGLNIPQLPFLEVLAKPAQVLRELVTKDPGFMMANLLRDSLQAWGIGNQIVPVVDTFKQYGKVLANMSPEAQKLMRAGIGTGYEFKGDVQATTEEFARQLRVAAGQRTAGEKAALPLTKAWDLLDQASTASDLATRAEVFKRTMEETNGNEAEAVFQAMEVMNFSRKGSNPIIQIAAAAIPFLNARIQGLDVLYRAGTGQLSARNAAARQKAFFVRGMTMMALSSLYWMLASETEEWQTAEQETRDNNWIIGPVRIPIPFELGVIFKVAPERILEYTFGDDTTKDLKMSFVRNLTSTLAVNPIPQAILPIVENVANYSFFTGQPIVGRGLEDVSKPFQVNTGTSLFAAKAGESLGLSPVQIDNLIRGYTGTLGGYAVMALDAVMRGQGDPTKATMGAEQLPVVKRFFASPESTGTVTQFYELKNKLDEVTRTINFLERAGKFDQMAEYMKENAMMVSMTPYIRTLEKEINMLRDTKRVVNNSQMEPDQKREVLDAIRSAEVNLTRNIQSVRKLVD